MFDLVENWLANWEIADPWLTYASWVAVVLLVVILAIIVNFVARKILLTILSVVIKRTRTDWDDALLERRVLHRAALIAPALVFYWLAPAFPGLEGLVQRLAMTFMLIVGGATVAAFLNAVVDVYQKLEVARSRPIKGFAQLGQIIVFIFIAVLVIAILFEQSPFGLLGGLGAMTAVLILVFKDTILGLVASFQISGSNIVNLGDWIEMPRYGADGTVIDISLHNVRVQNWDKTITTIPAYALISDSFKNWRGMQESGGRRIKRSINLDMTAVKFCNAEMIERFSRFESIAEYVATKKEELTRYNAERNIDTSFLVNGRQMTNIGTFRTYVEAYLKKHSQIHQEMTFLVRQLQPAENGLPLEIYVFSKVQDWAKYESIQADIFDHILAVLPMFDLRVFQNPSGADFRQITGTGDKT